MTLAQLWKNSRNQIESKEIRQIIAIAGNGRLKDGNDTSSEIREFLSLIPTNQLKAYVEQCLSDPFQDSGFVLQDIVNQIGKRLGFKVNEGRYRGIQGVNGYDGTWQFPNGHLVVVEVKTTDAYQISLDTIARYRRDLVTNSSLNEEHSSILIVLGRAEDTSGLEAQIRGSRFAWNMRLLSADALIRLLELKESIEDPSIVDRIASLLIPREFTKLDEIIDLVFTTAEEVKEDTPETGLDLQPSNEKTSDFYGECLIKLEKIFKQGLIKQSRNGYMTSDGQTRTTLLISKTYTRTGQPSFWFGYHPHQSNYLRETNKGFLALGCGSANNLLLIPIQEFIPWLDQMNKTESSTRMYWHINIDQEDEKFILHRKAGSSKIDLSPFLIK